MLVGRTGFNDTVLEDIYVQGLPKSILQKIFTQVTLPNGLTAWKTVIRNLDCLHQSLTELKQYTGQTNRIVGHTSQMVGHAKPQVAATTNQSPHTMASPQASDSTTPMDVDLQKANQKLRSATTAKKLDTLRTTAWSLISSVPKTNFQRRTSQILFPKP